MYIETDRILSMGMDLRLTDEYFGHTDEDIVIQQRELIDDYLVQIFGSKVCRISVLTVIGAMEGPDEMAASPIRDTSEVVAVRPVYRSVAFPETELDNAGLVPTLVFEQIENSSGCNYLAELFPYVALPLPTPHHIEAISFG